MDDTLINHGIHSIGAIEPWALLAADLGYGIGL